jgi:four helix bundle suffix protein
MQTFLAHKGNYEDWNVYQLSVIVSDITEMFIRKYLSYGDRTVDQMRQASRSGKQNIVEGSCAATTSRETEIKLTNVAKASLKELLEDYKDHLRFNHMQLWDKDDARTVQVRRFAKTHHAPQEFVEKCENRSEETVCNIAITLLHQLDYLLYLVIERAKRDFLENGGIREEMSRARRNFRRDGGKSE